MSRRLLAGGLLGGVFFAFFAWARLLLGSLDAQPPNPFEVIDEFYRAFSETDWGRVRELTTPALFEYLRKSGLMERWEIIKKQDPTIQYVMFLVLDSHVDPVAGEAWALGRVSWKSARRRIPDYNETVFLKLVEGSWKLTQIRVHPSVEACGDLYRAIQDADWPRFYGLLTARYRERLERAGVIAALVRDRERAGASVYVVFIATNFAETRDRAWVVGDVIWHPLSRWEKETPVVVSLLREKDGWKVDSIRGHWAEAK